MNPIDIGLDSPSLYSVDMGDIYVSSGTILSKYSSNGMLFWEKDVGNNISGIYNHNNELYIMAGYFKVYL